MGSYDLNGKVAFVTGAARGIGFETAKALHGRGASVTLLDLTPEETQAAAAKIGADRTLAIGADVRDEAALEAAVAATVERFGGLDVPVANAGIAPRPATVLSMPRDEFDRVIAVNLMGVVHTVRAALPHVVARQGHVVLIASIYAFTNGVLGSPYAVAKAGVEQLGRALRVELHHHGASASVAYFGFVDTRMVHEAFVEDPVGQQLEKSIPRLLRKKIQPSDAAAAIVRGIEGRSAQIIAPKRWRALAILRGITGPGGDALMPHDRNLREVLRELDGAAPR